MSSRTRSSQSWLQKAARKKRKATSETLTVRLDSRLKYLAEIAARKHHQTLSSFVKWAIEQSLSQVHLADCPNATVSAEGSKLWDSDEIERFAKLASRYPNLLDHREQVIWTLVRRAPRVWNNRDLDLGLLHRHWADFVAVARGETDPSILAPLGLKLNDGWRR